MLPEPSVHPNDPDRSLFMRDEDNKMVVVILRGDRNYRIWVERLDDPEGSRLSEHNSQSFTLSRLRELISLHRAAGNTSVFIPMKGFTKKELGEVSKDQFHLDPRVVMKERKGGNVPIKALEKFIAEMEALASSEALERRGDGPYFSGPEDARPHRRNPRHHRRP